MELIYLSIKKMLFTICAFFSRVIFTLIVMICNLYIYIYTEQEREEKGARGGNFEEGP